MLSKLEPSFREEPSFSLRSKLDYIIDLGGSIVNGGSLESSFLKDFSELVKEYISKGKSFGVIVGGGALCREYQDVLKEYFSVDDEDLDTIGIRATKLNAELVRIMLKKYAYPYVLETPYDEIREGDFSVIVFSGWKPGWSTDYVSTLVAERFENNEVISLSSIAGVYKKENGVIKTGEILPRLLWNEYEAMIERKWMSGMKLPFDPVATRHAKEKGMKVIVLDGRNLENTRDYLEGKDFKGTVIS